MFQTLYENNIMIYTYAGLCGLGLLLRFIVNLVYKHLVKESDRLGETKNKMLIHIKKKFETCYRLKIGVNNVDTFVDKNVLHYRFCGVLLSTWENLCGQVLMLNLLIVPIIAVFSVIYRCGQEKILFAGAVGIVASAVLMLVDKSINLGAKKKLLRLNLLDYLENFCKVRLEQEAVNPELTTQLRKELIQSREADRLTAPALNTESDKVLANKELNRRKEIKQKKEEARKLLAAKREEEFKRAEEARREMELRKQEAKKQAAARRREEERLKLEEEKKALEARREKLKNHALERQQGLEQKKRQMLEKDKILQSIEDELKPAVERSDMDMLLEGLEELAAEKERTAVKERQDRTAEEPVKPEEGKPDNIQEEKSVQNPSVGKEKPRVMSRQEEKLVEDVLREFFA